MANTKYYRLMLGKGSRHAEQCLAERFIGADYGIERDLSRELPDSWASSTRCSFLSIKKRIPKRPKLPLDLPAACSGLSAKVCPMEILCFVLTEQAVTVWEKSAAHITTNRGRYFHIVVQYDGWI